MGRRARHRRDGGRARADENGPERGITHHDRFLTALIPLPHARRQRAGDVDAVGVDRGKDDIQEDASPGAAREYCRHPTRFVLSLLPRIPC